MTSGTSQGLFIVIAIIIFGLFVGISYTIFGHTLKPTLAGIFTDATEETTKKLLDLENINYFPDENFEKDNTLYENFTGRGGTVLKVDTENLYEDKNTLHHTFVESGSQFKYLDDTVLWLISDRFKNVIIDDTLTISFNARASQEVLFTGRLGADFEIRGETIDYQEGYLGKGMQNLTIDEEWKHYELVYNVDMQRVSGYKVPAFVYWLDGAAELWISDLHVEIGREYVDKN